MRNENGWGSDTFFTFTEVETAKGKERLKKIYDLFDGCDEEEVAMKLHPNIRKEDYEKQEDYEDDIAGCAGVQRLYHEKFKLKKINDYKFTLECYTFYNTPTMLWYKIAKMDRYLRGNGSVTRVYENGDGETIRAESVLIISNGEFFYPNDTDGDEDDYIYGGLY